MPMKLFAAWEVDKTTPNCIPRQCSFTLTRLLLLRPLGGEVSAISIAVKMQSAQHEAAAFLLHLPTATLVNVTTGDFGHLSDKMKWLPSGTSSGFWCASPKTTTHLVDVLPSHAQVAP